MTKIELVLYFHTKHKFYDEDVQVQTRAVHTVYLELWVLNVIGSFRARWVCDLVVAGRGLVWCRYSTVLLYCGSSVSLG